MTLRTPPSWLQNGSHPAENDRLSTQALWATTGIIKDTSLAVTQNSPAGMSVRVASGWAAIVGTTQANMGTYVGYNDDTVVLGVTTADPTNPRIDRVCMTVNDAYYTGSVNNVTFQVLAGTPAGSPTAPATPANSISLATIAVGAGVSVINSGNITDTRVEITTNLPAGDITAVTAGNGLSGGGSSGSVTLTINTAVTPDLTTAQTLTNKTLTSPVLNGAALEAAYTTGTGFAGYTFYVTTNGAVQYSTANATANGTVNFASTSGVSLNTLMSTNQAITVALLITNGGTAYYPTAYQIDGKNNSIAPKAMMVKVGFNNMFDHSVQMKGFDLSPEIKEQLNSMKDGRFVIITENYFKGVSGNSAFEIYGLTTGLEMSVLERDPNNADTQGAFDFTFFTDVNKEPRLPNSLFVTSYALSKAVVDGLL